MSADPSPSPRRVSPAGIALIKRWEGSRLTAYRCPAGVWTIGFGSTGAHVVEGLRIDEETAEHWLRRDLASFERVVAAACPASASAQFDAMVSLAFNVGGAAFRASTLVRLHNAGDFDGAAAQFGRWVLAKGRKLPGLVKRRADEARLYRSAGA